MQSATKRPTDPPERNTPHPLAGRWRVDPQASHARFVARTLGGLVRTPGAFRSLSGNLALEDGVATGDLVIDAASIDTGNRLRDRHLRTRDFLNVKKHPELRFAARGCGFPDGENIRIDGQLLVAGTDAPLALEAKLSAPAPDVIELACQTQVDRMALGMRGAPGMVPRMVSVDVAIVLWRETP